MILLGEFPDGSAGQGSNIVTAVAVVTAMVQVHSLGWELHGMGAAKLKKKKKKRLYRNESSCTNKTENFFWPVLSDLCIHLYDFFFFFFFFLREEGKGQLFYAFISCLRARALTPKHCLTLLLTVLKMVFLQFCLKQQRLNGECLSLPL